MGAWGWQSFENDDALDWLTELEAGEDASMLTDAFDAILDEGNDDYMETPEASTAIAAAEVVAALLGKAAISLPEAVTEWTKGQSEVQPTAVDKAKRAVRRVLDSSELQEVWQESEDYRSWRASVEDLLKRLS